MLWAVSMKKTVATQSQQSVVTTANIPTVISATPATVLTNAALQPPYYDDNDNNNNVYWNNP